MFSGQIQHPCEVCKHGKHTFLHSCLGIYIYYSLIKLCRFKQTHQRAHTHTLYQNKDGNELCAPNFVVGESVNNLAGN